MQHLFVLPWLTPSRRTLHGIAVVAILVFGFFAILKSTSGGREAPAKELEHVPPQLNQGDSRGAKDGRVYRH